jgi:hypothetical protein
MALYTPIDEKHPLQAQSPYSASKISADKLAESYFRSFDLPVVTLRPTRDPEFASYLWFPKARVFDLVVPSLQWLAPWKFKTPDSTTEPLASRKST